MREILAEKRRQWADELADDALPEEAVDLYAMLDAVGATLDEFNVLWWVIGGTLLGAVRHGGILRQECDVDIVIPELFLPLMFRPKQYRLQRLWEQRVLPFRQLRTSMLQEDCQPPGCDPPMRSARLSPLVVPDDLRLNGTSRPVW